MLRKKGLLILVSFLCFVFLVWIKTLGGGDQQASVLTKTKENIGLLGTKQEANKLKEELRVAVSMHPAEFVMLQQLNQQYEDAHKGIAIHLENIPTKEAYQKFKKASQLGDAPDVMLLDNTWVNEFAALGYLFPIDEFFTTEQLSLQIEQVMRQVKWNGYIWAVPKDVDPYVLAYNKDRLKEVHVELPPTTAEEFATLNKLLVKPDEGKFGVYLDFSDPYAFISLLWSLDGVWHDDKKGVIQINDPANVKLLESVYPSPAHHPPITPNGEPWKQLDRGKIGMIVTTLSEYKQNAKEHIAIARLPLSKVEGQFKGAWLKGKSYSVSSKSAVAEEAFDWIKAMISIENEIKLWNAGNILPSLTSAYADDKIKTVAFYQDIIQAVEQGRTFPTEPELPQKVSILQMEMDKLWQGQQNFKIFVEQVYKAWVALQK